LNPPSDLINRPDLAVISREGESSAPQHFREYWTSSFAVMTKEQLRGITEQNEPGG